MSEDPCGKLRDRVGLQRERSQERVVLEDIRQDGADVVEGQVELLQFVETMEEKTGQIRQDVPSQLQRFQFVQRVENARVQSADLIVVEQQFCKVGQRAEGLHVKTQPVISADFQLFQLKQAVEGVTRDRLHEAVEDDQLGKSEVLSEGTAVQKRDA